MIMTILFYALTSFISASLLFIMQPMTAKMALPILGGAAFVWNICMMMFQCLLLIGYLYAYILQRKVRLKHQALIHIIICFSAIVLYPRLINTSFAIDPAQSPIFWLIAMIIINGGIPFMIMSATSPLIQSWYGAKPRDYEPYILYAASNIGSLGGLISYPVFIEPYLNLSAQNTLIFTGIIMLAVLFVVIGLPLMRTNLDTFKSNEDISSKTHKPITLWLSLAFITSSLLCGVTTHITNDLASIPLLWIIPLLLYLISLIIVFSSYKFSIENWRTVHLLAAPMVLLLSLFDKEQQIIAMLLNLSVFFCICLHLHYLLAALKPHRQILAEYFLWVSLGGALGSLFNNLIAPLIFNRIYEYPLMLLVSIAVIAYLNRDSFTISTKGKKKIIILTGLVISLGVIVYYYALNHVIATNYDAKAFVSKILFIGCAGIYIWAYLNFKQNIYIYSACIFVLLMICGPIWYEIANDKLIQRRNYFGVSTVFYDQTLNANSYVNGITLHGLQSRDERLKLMPTTYYYVLNDITVAIAADNQNEPIAAIGMGVGTMACVGHKNQHIDFYEIDPLVNEIAHDERYFTYLRDCPPDKSVIIGDGRIGISKSPDHHYGLILVDAFSSNAIPTHLITREAIALYQQKLSHDGVIAFNISNKHINFLPIVSAIAHDLNLLGSYKLNIISEKNSLQSSSQWFVMTSSQQLIDQLYKQGWDKAPDVDAHYIWRDDYSNIISNMIFTY
jgi:hypothetical protein